MKRVISALLPIILFLTCLAGNPGIAEEVDYLALYQPIIERQRELIYDRSYSEGYEYWWDLGVNEDMFSYSLDDVNSDGTPELTFFANSGLANIILFIYTVANGEVVELHDANWRAFCSVDINGIIEIRDGMSGRSYEIQAGGLNEVGVHDFDYKNLFDFNLIPLFEDAAPATPPTEEAPATIEEEPSEMLPADNGWKAAYLEILLENERKIMRYNWQRDLEDSISRPIAIVNIFGDETPELIFASENGGGGDIENTATLIVYTYIGESAESVLSRGKITVDLDGWYAGAFCLYTIDGSDSLWVYSSKNSDSEYRDVSYYEVLSSGGYETRYDRDYDGDIQFSVYGERVSQEVHDEGAAAHIAGMNRLITFSIPGSYELGNSPVWDKVAELADCGMSFDEAIEFLSEASEEEAPPAEEVIEEPEEYIESDEIVVTPTEDEIIIEIDPDEVVDSFPELVTIRKGDKGELVLMLQSRLIELGYLEGEADGDFGSKTFNAVIDFQKTNGLKADGVAGEKTQAALFGGE